MCNLELASFPGPVPGLGMRLIWNMKTSLSLQRRRKSIVTLYSSMVKAESLMCAINCTSGHIVATLPIEPRERAAVVTKYDSHWLNWTNATPFQQCRPSSSSHFLPIFMFSANLNILDCLAWVPATQNKVLCFNKGPEPFCAG